MVPADWHAENVAYLGLADQAAVEREFISADLFLAPISNLFGAKIKLLDALAFATPFIATDQAMTGLSFLLGVPRIDLNSPQQAALLASDLIRDPDRLKAISRQLTDGLSQYLPVQAVSWGMLAQDILARPI
jgi:glycosyltransferase involved in cell wall biosynthesis